MAESRTPLIEVRNLKRYFTVGGSKVLKAVDGITLDIYKGETLGLVGESGCGKSTLGRTLMHLYEATDGTITYDGIPINSKMKAKERFEMTRRMQMIFQDPYSSLNPRMKVMDIIAEGLDAHGMAKNAAQRKEIVNDLLATVGLSAEHAGRFPHEFSGGQRQRVGIARALAVNPEFIVADEPISALDVSIQAQVINLLKRLQQERNLTFLFIAHDLSMVRHISDRIGVMYLGSLVELAETEELFAHPMHPYTKALLSAIPEPDPDEERSRQRIMLEGTLPNPVNLPDECKFCSRCPYVSQECRGVIPPLTEVTPGHWVACAKL